MKKFILFTLLASGLSAHAMLGDNQENGGRAHCQNPHRLTSASRRITRSMTRQKQAQAAIGQAQAVQQDHAAEDLNQRSEGEVAPAAPAAAQEIPTEPNQNTRVIACQNPQNRTYDERGMAEIHNVPYSEQVGRSNNILKVIFGCLFTERAHYITSLLNKKIRGHFDCDFTQNYNAKYSHFKIQPILTFNVVLPPNIIEQLKAAIKWRKDSESNPIKSLTLASIQNVIALKEATQPPENEEAAKNLSNEEKNAIALKDAKIPEIAGSIADSYDNFLGAFIWNNAKKLPFDQWIKECFGTVSLEHIRITDSFTIAHARQLMKWAIPVKVDLIVDSWNNCWAAFLNNNPNNLLFNEWKVAYFGTVSPQKFKLNVEDRNWQKLTSFFNANRDHLNPNNFMIKKKTINTAYHSFEGNPEILSYLTGVTDFTCFLHREMIANENFKTFLKNNASTLTHLTLFENGISTKWIKDLTPELSKLKSLNSLALAQDNVNAEGAEHLKQILSNMTKLTTLNLANNKIGEKGVEILKDVLSHNSTIEVLDLSSNNIDGEGTKHLKKILSNMAKLTTLNLENNNIGSKGVEILKDVLSHNSTIEVLDLSSNNIDEEGTKHLKQILSNMTKLTTLVLGGNKIGNKGVENLADALSHNTTLKTLFLYYNNISDDVKSELKETCRAKNIDLKM